MKRIAYIPVVSSCLLVASNAWSQPAESAPPASVSSEPPAEEQKKDRGALVLGGKIGGLVAFSSLGPNVRGAIEVGYVFPWAKRSFAAVLDVGYAAPKNDGTGNADPRVPGATYYWHLTQQELTVMPTFVYRLTAFGRVVPYAGIGPRIYFLQSNVKGDVNGTPISETTEQSTKLGVGLPIGVQLALGPGAILGEIQLEYGPLDHTATGSSNAGAASLLLGYRFLL